MSFLELCFRYPLASTGTFSRGEDYFKLPLEIASEMGFNAKVYALRNREQLKKTEDIEGFVVHRFDNSFKLIARLLEERANLIHGHTFGWIPSTFAPLIKKPYVLTPHTDMAKPRNLKTKTAFYQYSRYMVSLWSVAKADKMLVQTNFTKKSFSHFIDEDRIEVLPLPINYRYWANSCQEKTDQFKARDTEKLIISAAYIQPRKNFRTLLYAFKLVKQVIPKAELAIVGPDPVGSIPRLIDLASDLGVKDSVSFLGKLAREDLLHAFHAADVFALPSLWECQCMAACEAAAAGLPLVLSNLRVLTEIFHGCALFHEPLDYETLAKQLLTILTDRQLAEKLGKTGQKKMKGYHVDLFKPRLRRIYEELVLAR